MSKPVIGKATNNTAEIQACIEALQTIKNKGIKLLDLYWILINMHYKMYSRFSESQNNYWFSIYN